MAQPSAPVNISLMEPSRPIRHPSFTRPLVCIVGGFGSGKTEVAVNLARHLALEGGQAITVIDLDLVNPYFRSRQATAELQGMGIKVIAPQGGQFYADLPIILPEIKGAIESPEGTLILDVGGDQQGTRALGSLSSSFSESRYEMLMVLNSRRPQTATVAGCLKTMGRIERSAHLKFTGLISNSHMIEETDRTVVLEGYQMALEVGRRSSLPVAFLSVRQEMADEISSALPECPLLPLTRLMLKPWERKGPAA